jgi:hypothetical protein
MLAPPPCRHARLLREDVKVRAELAAVENEASTSKRGLRCAAELAEQTNNRGSGPDAAREDVESPRPSRPVSDQTVQRPESRVDGRLPATSCGAQPVSAATRRRRSGTARPPRSGEATRFERRRTFTGDTRLRADRTFGGSGARTRRPPRHLGVGLVAPFLRISPQVRSASTGQVQAAAHRPP